MKKIISLILAVIMVFSVSAVFAVAADETYYEVTFEDLPYDVAPYRDDYVACYMGYEYGEDYWFSVTNNEDGYITINGVKHPVAAGTTTEIKGAPVRVGVKEGSVLEFTVVTADYVSEQTVRVIAFPTGTANEDLAELDEFSPDLTINPGEPYEQYYLAKSKYDTYGIKPDQNLTICLSEYHLYNDCFLYEFTKSDFYSASRVLFCGEDIDDTQNKESYKHEERGNTRVIYENETLFFEVRMDLNSEYDLHYDTYEVYYMNDPLGSLVGTVAGTEKVYLERVYRYHDYDEETGLEEQVDIYAIENVDPSVIIKVENTVTYTIDMLGQLISSGDIDLDSVDLSPMLDLIVRIAKLIVKMLNGFGLNISLGDLLG
ncbi:MAG: hypothetical protein IKV76_00945 [Clostridia bacterium]|nr:hypothetical protein [Clostridia bacterium]